MAVLFAIALAALLLEHDHLLTLYERVQHFYYNFRTFYGGCAYRDSALIVCKEHFVILNSLAFLGIFDAVHEEFHALLDLELLTVNFYNCVHFI